MLCVVGAVKKRVAVNKEAAAARKKVAYFPDCKQLRKGNTAASGSQNTRIYSSLKGWHRLNRCDLRAVKRINVLKKVARKRFIFRSSSINNFPCQINFSLDLSLKNWAH